MTSASTKAWTRVREASHGCQRDRAEGKGQGAVVWSADFRQMDGVAAGRHHPNTVRHGAAWRGRLGGGQRPSCEPIIGELRGWRARRNWANLWSGQPSVRLSASAWPGTTGWAGMIRPTPGSKRGTRSNSTRTGSCAQRPGFQQRTGRILCTTSSSTRCRTISRGGYNGSRRGGTKAQRDGNHVHRGEAPHEDRQREGSRGNCEVVQNV